MPHWNWTGKENQSIEVWAYSNCDEVELFLNKKSLGKQKMEKDSHLKWDVKYIPGTLEAIGFKNGKKILIQVVKTTGEPSQLQLKSEQIKDLAMITVSTQDKKGLFVPTANNDVMFSISGPAKIIGVGNGNPTSLEADKYIETIEILSLDVLKEKEVKSLNSLEETKDAIDISSWDKAFKEERNAAFGKKSKVLVYRTDFDLNSDFESKTITLYYKSIGKQQSIFINGKEIAVNIVEDKNGNSFVLDKKTLRSGKNNIAVVATPLLKVNSWDVINQELGSIQIVTPAENYKRKLFNGLAQVIVQATGEKGEIKLIANTKGMQTAEIILNKK